MSILTLNSRRTRLTAALNVTGVFIALLAIDTQVGRGQIPQADLSTEQLAPAVRGEVEAARTQYSQAKTAAKAGRDKEASAALHSLVQAHPSMIEAVHDLAYLQATSSDASVRDPKQAVANAEKVIDMAEKRLVQRRKIRGAQNVLNPFNNIPLAASFYQVRMLNTLAVAYAAAGNFSSPETNVSLARAASGGGGCAAPAARDLAAMALQAAQHQVAKSATAENKALLTFVEQTHATILSGKAVTGVAQP
jgi:hypothetical protein